MAVLPVAHPAAGSSATRWALRAFVLGAFALTVWLFGPRAVAVLAAKFEAASTHSPEVVLDQVGIAARPAWMDQALLVAVATELGPWLQDRIPILDEGAARRLRDGLAGVAWVQAVAIERVFPDRLRLKVDLRRPVLAVRAGDGSPLCLVDRHGTALPWVETPLPVVWLHREGGAPSMKFAAGEPVDEARVRAAAAVAVEWRDQLAPLVPGCPELLEVDATNLAERWMVGPDYPEIRVKLRRNDGAPVVFKYDRPVDSVLPRVPVRTKAAVLAKILAKHPGLEGLVAGDLRLSRRWEAHLQPRDQGVPDPNGGWSELPVPR